MFPYICIIIIEFELLYLGIYVPIIWRFTVGTDLIQVNLPIHMLYDAKQCNHTAYLIVFTNKKDNNSVYIM